MKVIRTLLCVAAATWFTSAALAEDLTLKVGTEPSFPPFENTDPNTNEIVGFDIDLMEAVAQASNFKVEWVPMTFDGLLPAVISGQLDAAISGFVINAERRKRVDFSAPYFSVGQGVMIHRDNRSEIESFDDLENRTLCVQIGSVGAQVAEKVTGSKLKVFNTTSEAYMELANKGCDAMITASAVHQNYLAQQRNSKLMMLPDIIDAAGLGIVMPKGNAKVKQLIDDGFAKIKADGTFQKVYDKWFSNK